MLKQLYSHIAGSSFGAMFARTVAGSAFAQISGMGLALLVSMVLARTLGPHDLGIYSLAMSTVAVLSIPTEFGLPTYLVREVAAAHVREDWGYLRSVLAWCSRAVVVAGLAVSVFAAFALALLSAQIDAPLRATVLVALPLVLFVAIIKTREAAMQGMNLMPLAQIPMLVLRPGLFLILLLIAWLVGAQWLSPAVAMALHSGATALVAATIVALLVRHLRPAGRYKMAPINGHVALLAAFPMAMTEGLRVLNGHVAIFMMGYLADARAVGLFKVGDAVSIICALPVWILNNVTAPQIARLHAAGDLDRLRKLVSYVGLAMTLGSFTLAVLMLMLGGDILSLLFGRAFADARAAMIVLCFGHAMTGMLGPAAVFMNMTGRERTVTRAIGVSLLVNLVLGSVAIAYAGAVGAAVANVVSSLIWNGWLWLAARRQVGVDTSLLPAVLALLSRHPGAKS